MIAQELEVSLHMAFVEARQQRHEFITVEHLLMALLDNPSAAEVLRACSANPDDFDDGSQCCVIDHIKLHDVLLIKVRFPSARTHICMKPGD